MIRPPAGTIICGPGDPDQAHVTDETCSVAHIDEAVAAYGGSSRLIGAEPSASW